MTNPTFEQQITLLRIAHGLSIVEMTKLCHLRNKISIIQFEHGRTHPLYATWRQIGRVFGVSMDWMAGLDGEPYRETVLEKYESLLPQLDICSYIRLMPEYENLNQRKKNYSLPIRANMVFLLHYLDNVRGSRTYQDKLYTFSALQAKKIVEPLYDLQGTGDDK
jgi:transcriptional regulator with XRE-family HTH domain